MKRNILIAVFLLLFAAGNLSADPQLTTESIAKAIDEVEAKYQSVSDLSSSFTQKTYVAVLNKDVASSGNLQWKVPGMFFIDYGGEKPKQYISNNKKIWVYVPGDTQVEVYKVSENTVSKEALELMRGFVDVRKNFNIHGWNKSGSEKEFTLAPRGKGSPYSKLKCRFRGDNLLGEVTIYNVTGNVSTYKFSDIRINTGLSDDIFQFKKPRGVKEVSIH